MMIRVKGGSAEALLKRALFLAYKAAGSARGMGVFQAARLGGEVPSEERVWACIVGREDYGGFQFANDKSNDVYADYVFGRMVKWGGHIIGPDRLEIRDMDEKLPPDYQGFASHYPTSRALLDAAAKELGIEYEEVGSVRKIKE